MSDFSKFLVEMGDKKFLFYQTDGYKLVYKEFLESTFSDETVLINDCKNVLNITLSLDNNIYLFTQDSCNDIFMHIFFKDKTLKTHRLVSSLNISYAKIISSNNKLNLFYTIFANNYYILYHRVISSDLSISGAVMLDTILTTSIAPFKVSLKKDTIFVSYIQNSQHGTLGYRKLNTLKMAWSSFQNIAFMSNRLYDYNILCLDEDIIFYCYTYNMNNLSYICYGYGLDNFFEKHLIKENEPILNFSLWSIYDKFYFIYNTLNKLCVNSLLLNENDLKQTIFDLTKDEYKIENLNYEYKIKNNIENDNTLLLLKNNDNTIKFLDLNFLEELNKSSTENISSLKNTNNYIHLVKKLLRYEDKLKKTEAVISNLNYTIKDLTNKNSFYHDKLKIMHESNINNNINQSNNLKNTIFNINKNLINKEKSLSELQHALVKKDNDLIESKSLIDELTNKISNCNLENKLLTEKSLDYENKISSLNNEICSLKEELEELTSKSNKSLLSKLFNS